MASKKLTASRPIFLNAFLEQGYAILYNDIDMVWQHNAWDAIDTFILEDDEQSKTTTTAATTSSEMIAQASSAQNQQNKQQQQQQHYAYLWKDGPRQFCSGNMFLQAIKMHSTQLRINSSSIFVVDRPMVSASLRSTPSSHLERSIVGNHKI
eukprot:Plantae.Rhodophyta-Palmaria_palmata.ctg29262.p1 GENE.Plantae.Rhodophyta-Palmaria_palmata.ctg29262~~Plantae.Rhodophyta-Palmaria_palmata.ctg29262.p1  ORF type:complete len:152 (+),score=17.44 Plantae.Rhodophyta-Palmaria_palmata.ctg29262:110-565(+)